MPAEASDNELLLQVPWKIGAGQWIQIGEAVIRRDERGDLEACDSYGCTRARIPPGRPVYAAPIPAIHRVLAATPYIYVEFEKSVYIEDGEDYWTLAPYEIEVYIGDIALARLSPVSVKFTLIGDVVDGILARYYRSIATYTREELPDPTGTAIVRFIVKGASVLMPGVGFPANRAKFYVDSEGLIYYPLLYAEVEDDVVTVKPVDEPPVEGVRELVEVRGMRRGIPVIFQYAQPFTMKVQVHKRSLATQ